jgi:hypothetical protein
MQVGLSECWDMKIRNDELGVLSYADAFSRDPFSFWQPVDTSFLEAIVNFAQYKQLTFIAPYWVNCFFAYLDYNTYGSLTQNTVLTDAYTASSNAILVGAFAPTGHAWESMNIPPDTTAPATPAAPTAPTIGTVGFNLQWTADTDNVGVSAYNLYRDGTLLTTTSGLVYYDNGRGLRRDLHLQPDCHRRFGKRLRDVSSISGRNDRYHAAFGPHQSGCYQV